MSYRQIKLRLSFYDSFRVGQTVTGGLLLSMNPLSVWV